MLLEQVLDDKLPNERRYFSTLFRNAKSPLRRVVREGFFYCCYALITSSREG
ncbi:MAG: hypothetical protein ACLUOF_07380 [Ruminococcus sp.]